jgi:hypothetical protein
MAGPCLMSTHGSVLSKAASSRAVEGTSKGRWQRLDSSAAVSGARILHIYCTHECSSTLCSLKWLAAQLVLYTAAALLCVCRKSLSILQVVGMPVPQLSFEAIWPRLCCVPAVLCLA